MHEEAGSENDKQPQASSKRLPTSKSMHQFYNRTWNERSLSKYSHNYENVYAGSSPNYENVYFGGKDDCEGCVINQLTASPRSARARLFDQQPQQPPAQPDYQVPPVPPE